MASHPHHFSRWALAFFVTVSGAAATAAPVAPPKDIHYAAEHLAEAAQGARYFALPWFDGGNSVGVWKPLAGFAATSIDGGFADARGTLWTAGAERGLCEKWRTMFVAHYDRIGISGGTSENLLTTKTVIEVPLALAAHAEFSDADGTLQHYGAAALLARRIRRAGSESSLDWIAGLMLERLDLSNYTVHYCLIEGTDAGAEGTLDHSGSSDFLTPLLGIQWSKPFGNRIATSTHFVLGMPRPSGDFTTRITGTGFDMSTSSTGGTPESIGDAFAIVGFVLRDRRTGLGIDLGSSIAFPVFEALNHQGVNRTLLLSLSWRKP